MKNVDLEYIRKVSVECVEYAEKAAVYFSGLKEIRSLNLPNKSLENILLKRAKYYVSEIKKTYDDKIVAEFL